MFIECLRVGSRVRNGPAQSRLSTLPLHKMGTVRLAKIPRWLKSSALLLADQAHVLPIVIVAITRGAKEALEIEDLPVALLKNLPHRTRQEGCDRARDGRVVLEHAENVGQVVGRDQPRGQWPGTDLTPRAHRR